jgi:hypothetical protein
MIRTNEQKLYIINTTGNDNKRKNKSEEAKKKAAANAINSMARLLMSATQPVVGVSRADPNMSRLLDAYNEEIKNVRGNALSGPHPTSDNFDTMYSSPTCDMSPYLTSSSASLSSSSSSSYSYDVSSPSKKALNQLAVTYLLRALKTIIGKKSSPSSSPITLVTEDSAYATVAVIRGARFWPEVMALAIRAGLDFNFRDLDTVSGRRTSAQDSVVLKIEHISKPEAAQKTYKENIVQNQIHEYTLILPAKAPDGTRMRHKFIGASVCPALIHGSTVVLNRLQIMASRDKSNNEYEKQNNYYNIENNNEENDDDASFGSDKLARKKPVHFRFTFMSHVADAVSLYDHLNRHPERLTPDLFVRLEYAVLTMWFSGYAHCDFHTRNVLLDRQGTPFIIDYGYAIVIPDDIVSDLKSWWAREWTNPDADEAYGGGAPERLKVYAIKRMRIKMNLKFNWEGNFLRCMAQRFDARDIVSERVRLYQGLQSMKLH